MLYVLVLVLCKTKVSSLANLVSKTTSADGFADTSLGVDIMSHNESKLGFALLVITRLLIIMIMLNLK